MRAPKDDSLINRTLFNHDPTPLFNNQKQTKNNLQQQFSAEKEFGDQTQSQEAHYAQTNYLRIFFYFKEFLTEWFTELSIRPTQTSIILTVTLYLIAISSTVQRRDGDRWLKSLLNTKLPGYTTLNQDCSWESFRNYTFKCLLESNNPHFSSSFRQDQVEDIKKYGFKQTEESSFNAQRLNNSAPIDETELHQTTLKEAATPNPHVDRRRFQFLNTPLGRGNAIGFEKRQFVDLYKDKALIHLRSPWEKGIRRDFVGFFVKQQLKPATQATSNTNQSDNPIVLPWYRIDACNRPDRVVLATPTEHEKSTNKNELASKEALFDQKWKRSGIYTGPETPVETPVDVELKEQKFNVATWDLNTRKGQYLRDRREQSVLSLREDAKRFALARRANTTYATDLNTLSAVPSHSIRERISGLEYILPFQTSKERVYAQNDSIPSKLESAYSLTDLLNSNSIQSGVTKRTASILEAALLGSTRSTLEGVSTTPRSTGSYEGAPTEVQPLLPDFLQNLRQNVGTPEAKNESFTKNNQLFFGKNFYAFQKRLRELFYWYGLFPPYNLMESIDTKLSQSQADKQTVRGDIHTDQYTENSNLDQTVETAGDKPEEEIHVKSFSPQSDEETEAENGLEGEELTNTAVQDFLNTDLKNKELSSDNLQNFVSRELEQGLKVASLDLLAVTPQADRSQNDSGFAQLFSRDNVFVSPQSDAYSRREKDNSAEAKTEHVVNALSQGNTFDLGIKQQIENLIDKLANQSDNYTDSDQLTSLEESVTTPGVSTPGVSNVVAPAPTVGPIRIEEIASKKEELQQTLAQFAFKHWPLLANVNSFAQPGGAISNRFEKSDVLLTRLMSGYRFPDCTKGETNRLFREFVLPHLLVAGSVNFSHSYLINQTLLRPLYIKLPPALPFSFFENLALSLCQIPSPSTHRELEKPSDTEALGELTRNAKPKHSHINIEYKRISLQELTEVKDMFVQLGKDYEDYSSLPKESAPALRISPSLEDDKALQLKTEQKDKRDEERITAFERLQKIREREARFELGKELRPFAYNNQFAFHALKMPGVETPGVETPSLENNISGNSTVSQVLSENSNLLALQATETPDFTEQENSWISFRLGQQNMCSDRKYSFFGRKHLLTKRLVAQEQKEIDEQISKGSYRAPGISLLGQGEVTNSKQLFADSPLTKQKDSDQSTVDPADQEGRLFPQKRLQKRARKGLIKLLGSPELSAHHIKGSLNRTRKANPAFRGKLLKSAYSHLRWQKKRFRSRVLGTPCKRHLVMPEITSTDWKKMLEWQLKNYLFLEEKRLEPLIKEDPERNFKIRQLHIYLPWVTIRTPSNKPFQWPYTRLDYTDCIIPAHIFANRFYELPEYKAVYYWDSGKSVSLSLPASNFSTNGFQKVDQNKGARTLLPLTRVQDNTNGNYKKSGSSALYSNGIRTRVVEEPYLCEPLNNQSWLLIYRLFLAFALQQLLKYIYRVSLKGFIIEVVNSDFGLRVTSAKFREWLEHARPKSFYTPQKRLRDVAAIEESIPILSEIVWYLRNFGRGRTASRGFLLVGPAGAEKTAVVQAIAGECGRPVVVQSISALALTNEDPYEQLEKAFTLARQQAPCVLFLDDLDVVGQSRAGVVKNNIGPADILFALDTYTKEGKLCLANLSSSLHTHLLPKGDRDTKRHLDWQFNPLAANPAAQENMEFELEQEAAGSGRSAKGQGGSALATVQGNQESQTRRLNLLLRLLTEMDGVAPLNGVVILATSEQPALLDPALLRAGRFERRIHLSLPNKERRIQLFKAGTQKLGCMQSIPWDYLGIRTTNMSGADIASAINHSAIRAILDNTIHTVESLEHGLNFVKGVKNTVSSLPVLQRSDPFHYSRLAFYQAGKAVVHNLLLDHPELGFCSLNDAVINQNNISGTGDITRESLQVLVSDKISPTTVSPRSGLRSRSPLKKGCASLSIAEKQLLNSDLSQQKEQDILMRSHSNSNVQSHKSGTTSSARTRIQFETRLVGLYAGKAAELLHLSGNVVSHSTNRGRVSASTSQSGGEESIPLKSSLALNVKRLTDLSGVQPGLVSGQLKSSQISGWLWQSNLGFSELLTASSLIHLMVDRWYLYSQKVFTYKTNKVASSLNHEQIRNETLFPLAKRLSQELQSDAIKPNFWGLTSYTNQRALSMKGRTREDSTEELYLNKQIYQERSRTDWWQAKVCQALEMVERPYGKWYRIYLPKIEEREQNKEWVPPDTIFHQSLTLSNLTTKTFQEKGKLATSTLPYHRQRILRETRVRDLQGLTRTRSGEAQPSAGAVPEKRASVEENNLTQPNRLRRPSWLRQQSTGSVSNRLIRRQGSLKRDHFPLRRGAQLGVTPQAQQAQHSETVMKVRPLHSKSRGGITWQANLNKMSSSNSVRSLRFLRLHLKSPKECLPSYKTLNDLYLFERDSAHQKAVMNCFYTAFSLLNENRELLDSFADHLIRYKILRSHEISKICSFFSPSSK